MTKEALASEYPAPGRDLDVAEYIEFINQRINALDARRQSCEGDDPDKAAALDAEMQELESLRDFNEDNFFNHGY